MTRLGYLFLKIRLGESINDKVRLGEKFIGLGEVG
jgi:hypothetical protein